MQTVTLIGLVVVVDAAVHLMMSAGGIHGPPRGLAGEAGDRCAALVTRLRARFTSDGARQAEALPAALAGLAADLEAGLPPPAAIRRGGQSHPWLQRAGSAATVGADVADALRFSAGVHGSDALVMVSSCWSVAAHTGAGLAVGVRRAAQAAAHELAVRQDLDRELAASRATVRILALLPVIGVVFGELMGAHTVRWLTGTDSGRLALMVGLLLMAAGWWWARRIVAAALTVRPDVSE